MKNLEQRMLLSVNIGSGRELFVDSYLIESLSGASLDLQNPAVAEMSLNFMDRAWEGSWSGQGPTVLKDGDLYRMYYYGFPTRQGPETGGYTCYAESRDGVHWTCPNLGLVQVNGTWNNNVIPLPDPARIGDLIRPVIDTRPGVPASEKYKAVGGARQYVDSDGYTWQSGLYILTSPDGLHWSKLSSNPFLPAIKYRNPKGRFIRLPEYDGMNTLFWSESEQTYVCLYRHWVKSGGTDYRWVGRTTSQDLVTWTTPVAMDAGGLPYEQWYFHGTSPYFRAPQIYIGMPAHYVNTPDPDFPNELTSGHGTRCKSRFVSSRGGTHYDRSFGSERWITTGLPNGDFQFAPDQDNWPVWAGRLGMSVVPTGPQEMSIYLEQAGRLVRYTLRTDGFVALTAGANGGEMTTKPFTFTGEQLEVNYKARSGGSLRIEIQDANGQPIPGFTLSQSQAMTGDEISRIVSWTGGSDTSALAGTTVRLRFVLDDADVYSFKLISASRQAI